MKQLALYLTANGLTQSAFAIQTGLSNSQLSRYLSGIHKIPLETAHEIESLTKGEVPTESWLANT
jgi:transcriptional regulator with XRE-family HTH domain